MDTLGKLEKLYLNNNQITQIDGLGCTYSLKHLDLSFNLIKEMKNLQALKNLITLNLAYNQIIIFFAGKNLGSITSINLVANSIGTVNDSSIKDLRFLLVIYLADNHLSMVPDPMKNRVNLTHNPYKNYIKSNEVKRGNRSNVPDRE